MGGRSFDVYACKGLMELLLDWKITPWGDTQGVIVGCKMTRFWLQITPRVTPKV